LYPAATSASNESFNISPVCIDQWSSHQLKLRNPAEAVILDPSVNRLLSLGAVNCFPLALAGGAEFFYKETGHWVDLHCVQAAAWRIGSRERKGNSDGVGKKQSGL
jgi:hypothetical protein